VIGAAEQLHRIAELSGDRSENKRTASVRYRTVPAPTVRENPQELRSDTMAASSTFQCPSCGSSGAALNLERVPRRFVDRVVSIVRRQHRYRCRAAACGWEGNIPDTYLAPQGNLRRSDRRS